MHTTRRAVLGLFAGFGLLGEAVAQENQSVQGWRQSGYNAANTGYTSAVSGPTEGISEQWRKDVDGTVQETPAVVDGRLYLGRRDGVVAALDTADGSELWQTSTGYRLSGTPLVVDGTVCFAHSRGVIALDAVNGTEQWEFDVDGTVDTPPTGVDGMVYVSSRGTDSPDSHVYALDAADGTEQWRAPVGSDTRPTSPAVADGVVYVGRERGRMYAFRATDGTELWQSNVAGNVPASPAVTNDTVYLTSTGNSQHRYHVYALDAADGDEQWQIELDGTRPTSPAVANGELYIVDSGGSGVVELNAVSVSDGSEQWYYPFIGPGSRPIVVGKTVYVGGRGALFALDPDRAAPDWQFRTMGTVVNSPAVADGTVYVPSDRLHSLREGNRDVGSSGVLVPGTDRHVWEWQIGAGVGGLGMIAVLGKQISKSGTSDEANDTDVETRLNQAAEAVTEAETARTENELSRAEEKYEAAVDRYQTALEDLPKSDDCFDEVQAALEKTTNQLERVQEQLAEQAEFVETLTTAETHFQTAAAAPVTDKVVIPREQYRQARNAYDEALDILGDNERELLDEERTVSLNPTVDSPPENLNEFPGVHPGAEDVLADLNLDTLTKLRDAESETIETLLDTDAIGHRLGIRLAALNRWHAGDAVVFMSREDIERRREFAVDGYQAHQ